MSDIPPIATERLELVSMSSAFIEALLAGRPRRALPAPAAPPDGRERRCTALARPGDGVARPGARDAGPHRLPRPDGRTGGGGAGLHGAAAVSPPRLRPGGGPGADGLGGARARRAAVPAVHRAGQRALPGDGGEDGLPPRRRADGRRRRPGARLRARPRVEPDSPSNIA